MQLYVLPPADRNKSFSVNFGKSEQVPSNFWTDPTDGIPYYIAVQISGSQMHSLDDLGNTPVSTRTAPPTGQSVPGESQQCPELHVLDAMTGSQSRAETLPATAGAG